MSLIIRKAASADVPALTGCYAAAYAPFQHLGLPPVTEGVDADIADHNVWVAEVDGTLRGGVVLVLGKRAYIANLAVHPDASGQGVGPQLIAQALAAAKAAGHGQVHLVTHCGMTRTQGFYRRHGWTETGRDGDKVYFATQLN
ncbi:GNAT family N-acetyltransferase [Yoonia sp. BS5-3]|uniref:GNAT family N-acetyltransferase n=1 Tax=Yoonia phaeophyticola TaxID=3137369 RepID=A0ABZ2V9D0_9RHOB